MRDLTALENRTLYIFPPMEDEEIRQYLSVQANTNGLGGRRPSWLIEPGSPMLDQASVRYSVYFWLSQHGLDLGDFLSTIADEERVVENINDQDYKKMGPFIRYKLSFLLACYIGFDVYMMTVPVQSVGSLFRSTIAAREFSELNKPVLLFRRSKDEKPRLITGRLTHYEVIWLES